MLSQPRRIGTKNKPMSVAKTENTIPRRKFVCTAHRNFSSSCAPKYFEITTPPPTAIPAKNVITDIFTFDDKLTAAKASLLAKFPTTQASAIL